MKIKIAIIVLAIACIGLGVALFATKKQGDDQHATDVSSINDFSNQLVAANVEKNDLSQANLALTNDLAVSREETLDISNSLTTTLASTSNDLSNSQASLTEAQGQITNLNVQVSDLELQNKVLDERAAELTNTIAQMNDLIVATQSKLDVAETNTAFLADELQKQMTQKAELEHKFNDVNEVRAQVQKLRDEIYIARRMAMSKYDNAGKKGGQMLTTHTPPPSPTNSPAQSSNYNLNVEVGSDGSVKVIPPLGATNTPAP